MAEKDLTRLIWRKSTASGGSECVEVAILRESVCVRDSKAPRGPVLRFTHPEWVAFLEGVRGGEFGLVDTSRAGDTGASD